MITVIPLNALNYNENGGFQRRGEMVGIAKYFRFK